MLLFLHCEYFLDSLNNKEVINRIKNLKKRDKGESIMTYGLSTLYTKIPHSKLLRVLNELIDFCFDGGLHKYISVNKFVARWISVSDSYFVVFDKFSLKMAIEYVLDNCFLSLDQKCFNR